MDAEIYVSLIVPVYNQAYELPSFFDKIVNQESDFLWEVILVDDGSTDNSLEICRDFCSRKSYASVYFQENSGVSAARNLGIQKAKGKYLFFIDSDDELTDNAVKKICNYFDSVYDQTDLITYPIRTIYKKKTLESHFRYDYLTCTGLYDLRDNPYIGQTTMNIVVKNLYEENILFNTYQSFSEDQRYCCDVLSKKLVMGYFAEAEYIYHRSDNSSSGKLMGACFIFEQCTSFFEELFSRFEVIPDAYQGLFLNDFYWKMCSNVLFPYHYSDDELSFSIHRLRCLIRRCNPFFIINHPRFDYFEKYYLIKFYDENLLHCEVNDDAFSLVYSKTGSYVSVEDSVEFVLTRFQIINDRIRIAGFLKSVFFLFYESKPELYIVINNGKESEKLELRDSAHDYYRSHNKTQKFYAVDYEASLVGTSTFRFSMRLDKKEFSVHFYFMPLTPFSHLEKIWAYKTWGWSVYVRDNEEFLVSRNRKGKTKRIWIYYDCVGTSCDNGLFQFIHDYHKDDDVKRFYVISDNKQIKHIPKDALTVSFGSRKHRSLLFNAEKVITSYIENNNIIPFPPDEYNKIANKFKFETIYLQHGVLHIDMPWKYSPEKILADKVVVSSDVDYCLFTKNGFKDENLWKNIMPRMCGGERYGEREKKILYAPSWRDYLTIVDDEQERTILFKKFYTSNYYLNMKRFLESDRLHDLLIQNGYQLNVKLHPILSGVDLKIETDNIIYVVDHVEDERKYELFITDFSSYMFDFLFLKIPVLSYIPDYDEFTCGMNGYRKVDFMDKVGEEFISKSPEQIINAIEDYIRTGKRMDYFPKFYRNSRESSEEIYERLIGKTML